MLVVLLLNKSFSHSLNLQDCEDLPSVQLGIVELSNEDGSDALEDGSAIHVNRGPNGQNEAADAFIHTIILLHTLYHRG